MSPTNTRHAFLTKFAAVVRGVLSGFDRLFFGGRLRRVSSGRGLQHYLWALRIPYKDFAAHSLEVTARLEAASLRQARQLGRAIRYLNSAQHRQEDIAREIAARDRLQSGRMGVLRSVDPCRSFPINQNHQTRKLEIHYRQRQCLHLYHDQSHPVFGFLPARRQTWFPFRVWVCLNGRAGLARPMDQAQRPYVRRANTFTWLEDVAQAQALFDQPLRVHWPSLLGDRAAALHPVHDAIFARYPCQYSWTVSDSAWASDVWFRDRAALDAVYPRRLRYAVNTVTAVAGLRFLGRPVPVSGQVPHPHRHEGSSNVKERRAGIRLKHWLPGNSVMSDDQTAVLRGETLIRDPPDFQGYRPAEGAPDGPKAWRPRRRGVADRPRRAEVGPAAKER